MDIIENLNKIPYYDENNNLYTNVTQKKYNQLDCSIYIEPTDIVLEIGGRYGTVSNVINTILKNKKNHIVIDADCNIIDALRKNRDSHNCDYIIVNGYISNKNKNIMNFNTGTFLFSNKSELLNKNIIGYISIPDKKITYSDFKKKYDLKFNVLVLDCEGCLQELLNDIGTDINNFDKILFEKDWYWKCNYDWVHQYLQNNNFITFNKNYTRVYMRKSKINIVFPYLNDYNKLNYPDHDLSMLCNYKEADIISEYIFNYSKKKNIKNKLSIVDCMAGIGGNTYSFSKYFNYVVAIEDDNKIYQMLKNNINIYKLKNINLVNTECIKFLFNNLKKYDIFYFDPTFPLFTDFNNDIHYINFNLLILRKYKLSDIIDIIKKEDDNKIIIFRLIHGNNNYNLKEFKNYKYTIYNINSYNLLIF